MPKLTVDGRTVAVAQGTTVLTAARQAGAQVPTLCHPPALEPGGGCRLCMVELTRPEWEGWKKLVAACMAPAEEGAIILTKSDRVESTRRVVVDLLLARCPDTPLVQELARTHGITSSSFAPNSKPTDCVLCGLCTRACDALGVGAIAFCGRGVGREVAPPFNQAPPDCIGCLACAHVCPTRCIPYVDTGSERRIWGKDFEMVRCAKCGLAHVTLEQVDYLDRRKGVARALSSLCDTCKRQATLARFAQLAAGPQGAA